MSPLAITLLVIAIVLIVAIVVTLITKAPGKEVEAIYARATDKSIDD